MLLRLSSLDREELLDRSCERTPSRVVPEWSVAAPSSGDGAVIVMLPWGGAAPAKKEVHELLVEPSSYAGVKRSSVTRKRSC